MHCTDLLLSALKATRWHYNPLVILMPVAYQHGATKQRHATKMLFNGLVDLYQMEIIQISTIQNQSWPGCTQENPIPFRLCRTTISMVLLFIGIWLRLHLLCWNQAQGCPSVIGSFSHTQRRQPTLTWATFPRHWRLWRKVTSNTTENGYKNRVSSIYVTRD